VVSVVQIETAPALENVDAIARTAGVDVIFVGPRDLSYALGVPGQTDAPEFRAALERVAGAAKAAGIAAGILAPDRVSAERHVASGFTFVAVGSDCSFISAAASAAAAPLHATVA
jgi:2-keto-3-deoxy-L-rhamnonate aldolase RhmA